MAIITEISVQKKNKNRSNIYLDNEFYCGLENITVVQFRLTVGTEISKDTLENAQFESEKEQALTKAVGYISRAQKSKRQIKDYLINKGYLEKVVNYSIDKLIEYGYIDDLEYCKSFIRAHKNSKGKKAIERDLKLKGIDFNLVEKALDEELNSQNDAVITIAERYMRNREKNKENFAKLYRYILSKGFDYEQASLAVAHFKGDEF
ncbi:MAG: RecX family transcriptional regulator [Clostridia bacterium]|nr:RecX family transcriptional regulator [Clostridia bacterium]